MSYPVLRFAVSPEGSVTVMPQDPIRSFGEDISFTCSAMGGPGNTFQWQRNDQDIDNATSETLSITGINATTDGGTYTCTVSNTAGTASDSSTLMVNPLITLQPLDTSATNGSSVTLTCEAESFPAPSYSWEVLGGGALGDTVMGANTSTLTFSPVVFGNEGEYRCNASANGVTDVSNTATLTGMGSVCRFLCSVQ